MILSNIKLSVNLSVSVLINDKRLTVIVMIVLDCNNLYTVGKKIPKIYENICW